MAYDFDGNSASLSRSETATIPLTFSAWINPDVNNENASIVMIRDTGGTNNFIYLLLRTDGDINMTCRGTNSGDTNGASATSGLIQTAQWQHIAGTATSAGQSVWYNGTKYTTGSGAMSTTPASIDQFILGDAAAFAQDFNGSIEMVGAWNVELTDSQITMLSLGYSPEMVRPDALLAFCPLIRNTNDIVTGALSTTGGVAVEAPSNDYIFPEAQIIPFPSVAGGLSIPIAAYHYNHNMGSNL